MIQWTDSSRYNGLGNHAARLGGSASSLDTQLNYMLNESDWKMIERGMKTPGRSIDSYMGLASRWIRWGITVLVPTMPIVMLTRWYLIPKLIGGEKSPLFCFIYKCNHFL